MLRTAAYLAGAVILALLVHGYLYQRSVIASALSSTWRKRLTWGLAFLALLFPLGMAQLLWMGDIPRAVASPLMWLAFGWVGVLLFLLPLMLMGEVLHFGARAKRVGLQRRRMLARVVTGVSASASGVLSLGSVGQALRELVVRRYDVSLAGWPAALRGYRIVQISDVHVSATVGRSLVEEMVAKCNAARPDLIVVTGDLVDGSVKELGDHMQALRQLKAQDGVLFVTGNHEYLSGVQPWLAFVEQMGMRVLRNEGTTLRDAFDVVGIDDDVGGDWEPGHGPDLKGALASTSEDRPIILLAHRPNHVLEASRHGVVLQLSGHTHGGQLRPYDLLDRLVHPWIEGWYREGATQLYVSPGTGFWGPPMRLGTTAEVTVFDISPS